MDFKDRLKALRKEKDLTQAELAEVSGVHLSQIKSYEHGGTRPTIEAMRKLSVALHVSADRLLFDQDEREPPEEFKYAFEALNEFDETEKVVIERMLRGLVHQKQTRKPE